jgi:hypothetical protein
VRINAYVFAADAEFVEQSVASYYDLVDRLVVSYDAAGRAWNGTPLGVEDCLARLRSFDKVELRPGRFCRTDLAPIVAETAQRRDALELAGVDADWVLQIDADEVLPDRGALLAALRAAEELGLPAVEWPMRVLFRSLGHGRFLEVCDADGGDRYEYPGAVAVRPGTQLANARRVDAPFLRVVVRGDRRSLQITRPAEDNETRLDLLDPQQAIIHYSWAGSRARIRSKVDSWGHSNGWRTRAFYLLRWRPAPFLWRTMRNFHPFAGELWPALKVVER